MPDEVVIEGPGIEAIDGGNPGIDGGAGKRPPGMLARPFEHSGSISGEYMLVSDIPFDVGLLERIEPLIQVLAIGPYRLRGLGVAMNLGMFEQIGKGRLDDGHVRVEQDGEPGGNAGLTWNGTDDRHHGSHLRLTHAGSGRLF